MIIPQLKGGLGNQLFQISTAAAHAKRMDTEMSINYSRPFSCIQGKHPTTYQHTDDWQTVRKEFKHFPSFTEVNGRNELEDLYILSQGNYIIGSNSTFAWWGAYLGTDSTNIFPAAWFGPDGPKDVEDLVPEQWIRL